MAAQDAAHGQVEATEGAMLLDGLAGILRTGGGEAAAGGREGGDELLIEKNGQQQQPLQWPAEDVPKTLHGRTIGFEVAVSGRCAAAG